LDEKDFGGRLEGSRVDVIDECPKGLDGMEAAFPLGDKGMKIGMMADPMIGGVKKGGCEGFGKEAFPDAVDASKEERMGQPILRSRFAQIGFDGLIAEK
jgi:hypothetical protein